jgi:hypothetical protein
MDGADMEWYSGWEIDEAGWAVWRSRFGISDGGLKTLYLGDGLMRMTLQHFCECGVKVGMA